MKMLGLAGAAWLLAGQAALAQSVSRLPSASAASSNDLVPALQGAVTRGLTVGQINSGPMARVAAEQSRALSVEASKQDINGDSSGQPVTPTNGGAARTQAARASDRINLIDFLPAAGNDVTLALANAVAAAPNNAEIWMPFGTYSAKSCQTISTNKSFALKGSGHGATRIMPYSAAVTGCRLLTITETDINQSIVVGNIDFVPLSGVIPSGALAVSFPVTSDPTGHYRTNGTTAQSNLLINGVHVLFSNGDLTARYASGIKIYGAWRATVRESGVVCGNGAPPTTSTGSIGFEFGQVESLVYDNDSVDACYYGFAMTDYSEGVILRAPQAVTVNIGVYVADVGSAKAVGAFSLDQLIIDHGEMTAYQSPLFFAGGVNQAVIHHNHLMALADTNAVAPTATSCPTVNTAAQYLMSLTTLQGSFIDHNKLDGGVYTLNNGVVCQFVTGGEYLTGVSANNNIDAEIYQYLGASLNLNTPTLNNMAVNLNTLTSSSTGASYLDAGTANTNAVTYRSGNKIVSLH